MYPLSEDEFPKMCDGYVVYNDTDGKIISLNPINVKIINRLSGVKYPIPGTHMPLLFTFLTRNTD